MEHEGIYQWPSTFDYLMIKWMILMIKFRNCKLLPNPKFIKLSKKALMIITNNYKVNNFDEGKGQI